MISSRPAGRSTVVRSTVVGRALAAVVTLVAVVGLVGLPAESAAAAADVHPGGTCTSRQRDHIVKHEIDRLRCTRSGRGHRWTVMPRPRVLLLGDSLAAESHQYFHFFGTLAGADVRTDVHGGTAICDYFPAMVAAISDFRPDSVVLAFSGNALTPCMQDAAGLGLSGQALVDKYATDVIISMWILGHTASRIYWVGPPAGPGGNTTTEALNALYQATPWLWGQARFIYGGEHISPGGTWTASQPCLFFEPCLGPVVEGVPHNIVRSPDNVHFCPSASAAVDGVVAGCGDFSSGALRYALAMLSAPMAELGL